jgi:monothiol glutaredoxin
MSEEVINSIKKDIEENKVVLYMKGVPQAPQCGFSAATVQIIQGYEVPFKAVDVLANPEIRQNLPAYSKWPTFPQLFVDGKLIGGCDIIHEMRDSGDLEAVLKNAFKDQ